MEGSPLSSKNAENVKNQPPEHGRTAFLRTRYPTIQRSYIVPVLSCAFRIMKLLEETEIALKVDLISRISGTPKSTTYGILRTLSAHGYPPCIQEGVYAIRAHRGWMPARYAAEPKSKY